MAIQAQEMPKSGLCFLRRIFHHCLSNIAKNFPTLRQLQSAARRSHYRSVMCLGGKRVEAAINEVLVLRHIRFGEQIICISIRQYASLNPSFNAGC